VDQHLVAEGSIELALCRGDRSDVANLKSGIGRAVFRGPYAGGFDEGLGVGIDLARASL
jgi:hypothetical protein